MADVNEALIKEAIRRAEEKAAQEATQEATEKAEAPKDSEVTAENDKQDDVASAETNSDEGACEDTQEAEESGEKQDDASEAAEGEEPAKKKINLFGKKEKKDKRDEQIAELNDKLLRNLAEFQNFRNRSEKEKEQRFEIGAKSIIEKILPTVDNFERGLATVPEDKKEDPFVQGMEKIYKQMLASLEEAGVKPIEAVGQEFDPNLHNAVMHEENDAFGENTVSEEFQKGYMYRDTVVRHSMVKVAN